MKDCCDSWHLGSEIKQIKLLLKSFSFLGQKCFKYKKKLNYQQQGKTPSGQPDKN